MLLIVHKRWAFHVWEAALPFTFSLLLNTCTALPAVVQIQPIIFACIGDFCILVISHFCELWWGSSLKEGTNREASCHYGSKQYKLQLDQNTPKLGYFA